MFLVQKATRQRTKAGGKYTVAVKSAEAPTAEEDPSAAAAAAVVEDAVDLVHDLDGRLQAVCCRCFLQDADGLEKAERRSERTWNGVERVEGWLAWRRDRRQEKPVAFLQLAAVTYTLDNL